VTIEIQCPACQRKLRVPEKFAGRRAKCPGCQGVVEIPADAGSGAAAPAGAKPGRPQPAAAKRKEPAVESPKPAAPTEPQWYVHTEDGDEYGPVSRQELETWIEEGRVDAGCQVFCDGWPDWKWASEEFPQLASPAAAPAVDSASDSAPLFTPAVEPQTPAVPQVGEGGGATTGLSRTSARKYRALVIVSTIYTVLAWIVAILGVLAAVIYGGMLLVAAASGGGALLVLGAVAVMGLILLYSFLIALTLKAFAELIKLAMDVQENTHITAQAVSRLAQGK